MLQGQDDKKKLSVTEDGWKSVANWRKLTTDMGTTALQEILGEPERIDGGTVAFWSYENGGKVSFIEGRVSSWSEPR